jgi:hypothetical protein
VIERLPSKCKALSSKPSSAKRKTKKKGKKRKVKERLWIWWSPPVISVLTRLKQEGLDSESVWAPS